MATKQSYRPSQYQKTYKKWKIIFFGFFFVLLNLQAKTIPPYDKEIKLDPIVSYDQVPIDIIVKGYLRFEVDAIITDKRLAYVNIEELFKKLGISCNSEKNGSAITGFIENENNRYVIDFNSKRIIVGDKTVKSTNGIAYKLGAIYIETSVLSEAFNMQLIFNFRSLSAKLEANFELPIVKLARLDKMRKNIKRLQSNEEDTFDTILGRDYHLFRGGTMDWAVSSFQAEGFKPNKRFFLGLGSELLYGEARVSINYLSQRTFDRRQLYYNWRWINNDNSIAKQIQLGKIVTQAISFLGAPVIGARINNSPNTIRKAKGTYTISDYSEPNWTIELYINDALVDYTSTDASGFYLFNVPVVYGYTTLTLKFYGPLGEERIEEKIINTPYTFMPSGVLEYNIAGGVLEDNNDSSFARSEVNYGVNRSVTIGGGVEYLSSIPEHTFIPFANLAYQPFSKMILNFKYAHNVSFKSTFNYYFGRSAFLEFDYNTYVEGQQATIDQMNEERMVQLSLPYRFKKFGGNTKLTFNQFIYNTFNFNQLNALVSARYKNNSLNISVASNWINNQNSFITSTLVFSRKFSNGFIIRPTIQYNISENNLIRIRAEIEKRAARITYSASIEKNIQFGTNNINLSIRYDLAYARTGVSSFYNNNQLAIQQSAQGSLAFGVGNGSINPDYNSAMGKGGIICYPFLDLNQNGTKEADEPRVLVKNVRISGGKIKSIEKDSIIRISDLNSFIKYKLTFDDGDLENIGWKFKHKTYQVLVDPHQFKKIEIPILVYGEVTGMIYEDKEDKNLGLGRITIHIYDTLGRKIAETQSESDGYYSYLGLNPGEYLLRIDEDQLKKIGYKAKPIQQKITIKPSITGDFVENLNFVLY
ncbi:MAG: hypothetical protein ACJA1B_001896 [Polaribacter sp.]|jgi:hypothetical protein